MAKSKNRRKTSRNKRRVADRALGKKVSQIFPGHQVIVNPVGGGITMSEVLGRFMEPYRDFQESEKTYRKLIHLSIFAWNLTLFPQKERKDQIEEFLTVFPEDIRNDGRGFIEKMMIRKESLFSQYRQAILGFELTDTESGWHLAVAASAASVKE